MAIAQPMNDWRPYWSLDPNIIYLNHGSFGACPLPVLAVQQQLRQQLERQPVAFLDRDYEGMLDAARLELAHFVGTAIEDLVFVPNATTGVNAVLRSLKFQPGDQILTTDHGYNACLNALNFIRDRDGVEIVVAHIPFPLVDSQQVIDAVMNGVSSRTQLALLDHVTSKTGLIFPIETLIQQLHQHGVQTLIDGAHAPGMLPLSLENLGATYYTGNCHKWLCAPKGAAFLYVQRDYQSQIRPLTISHGANSSRQDRSRFQLEFDWMGTDDPTAYLSVPAAIAFVGQLLPGGWSAVMTRNRELILEVRQLLCKALQMDVPCPDSMIGTLASLPLPDGEDRAFQAKLLEAFGIEVPIFPFPARPQRMLRVSAHLYNQRQDYQKLAAALSEQIVINSI